MFSDRSRYYFTELEFCLLMAAAGRKVWYGPDSGAEEKIASQEDLNRVMARLYQKGYLDWEDSAAVIAESVAPLFRVLRSTKHCILTGRAAPHEEITYNYVAEHDQIVQIIVSPHDDHAVTMMGIPADEWVSWMEDSDFFPESCGEAPDTLDLSSEEVFSFMELHDARDGALLEQLLIVDEGPYGVLVHRRGGREQKYLCSREEYAAIVADWMRREIE